jgi:hypothetical protein
MYGSTFHNTESKTGCGGTTRLPEAALLAGKELLPAVDGQLMLLQREGLRGLVVALSTRVFHLQKRILHIRTIVLTYGKKGSEFLL